MQFNKKMTAPIIGSARRQWFWSSCSLTDPVEERQKVQNKIKIELNFYRVFYIKIYTVTTLFKQRAIESTDTIDNGYQIFFLNSSVACIDPGGGGAEEKKNRASSWWEEQKKKKREKKKVNR